MPTSYPVWTEKTWGRIAGGSWKSPGYLEAPAGTYGLKVTTGRPPAWEPDPPPPPPDQVSFLISESDWARIRFGTLDGHDPTVIHKDQNSYKVQAIDNSGYKTAVVVAI